MSVSIQRNNRSAGNGKKKELIREQRIHADIKKDGKIEMEITGALFQNLVCCHLVYFLHR